MLRDKPSEALAKFIAPLLAQEHRFESAPILMRFALLGEPKSVEALEAMGVPQASLAILRNIAVYEAPSPTAADFPIPSDDRQKLARLLGKDAGPNFLAWTSFYDATDGKHPTPLTPEMAADLDRVIHAITSYWDASQRLYEAKCRLYVRRVEEDGNGKYFAQLNSLGPTKLSELDRYQAAAFRNMAVTIPNWNVPGTPGLEQEAASYATRVNDIITHYRVEARRSATTSPLTNPLKRK